MSAAKRNRNRQSAIRDWMAGFDRRSVLKLAVIGGLTLPIAFFSGKEALVGATRVRSPDTAYQLDRNDPRAAAQIAARLVENPQTRKRAIQLAKRAITEQALVPMAFGVLTTAALADNKVGEAEQYIAMSRKLSRRDERTNLHAVDLAGRRGNVEEILRNYDIALRTNSDLAAQLMPRLVAAMELPQFAPYYTRLAQSRPPWLEDFTGVAAETSKNPEQIARMLIASGGLPKSERSRGIETLMLSRLDGAREWQLARRYYLSLPYARPQLLTSTRFASADADPAIAPISWVLTANASLEAGLFDLAGRKGQGLSAIAQRRERGVVARKLLFFAPGSYRVETVTQYFRGGRNSEARVTMFCANSSADTPLGEQLLSKGKQAFVVPIASGCAAQLVEFRLAGGDEVEGAELAVDSLKISKQN